ncbi:MAG: DNA translocase FtsK 4TM domain-containing protein, partial [Candidatus Moraniibacteriota bacterium]
MAKKKKNGGKEEQSNEEKPRALGGDAKRGIIAVLLFAIAILFLLSFVGQAGSFGKLINDAVGVTVGWSRWLLIPMLPLIGYLIIRRHTTSLSDVIKYIGLGAAFLAFLGLSHLFLGSSAKALLAAANAGQGGGLIGYLLASGLDSTMGKIAAFVVLFAFFVTGVIAAFNVSLLHWCEGVMKHFRKDSSAEKSEDERVPVEKSSLDIPDPTLSLEGALKSVAVNEPVSGSERGKANSASSDEQVLAPPTENIQNIRFVENETEGNDGPTTAIRDNGSDDETVLVPAFIRPKRRRIQWELPPLELLAASDAKGGGGDIEQSKDIIVRTLKHFHIDVEPGEVQVGPTVTQYTFRPAVGVKISSITPLHGDLALALAAQNIRIEAPIPGKSLIGIEVPNKAKVNVRLRELLQSKEFREHRSNLTIVLGQDVSGQYIYADLGRMPHLLIAGTTRSGKSVCINTIILSLLYQNSPEDLKFIFVDPK